MYDMLIIGSGPAGMSAAVYGKRAGLNLVVLEKNPVSGGQIIDTYEVDNYLGLPGINGFDLAQKFREHVDRLGAEVQDGEVTSIEKRDGGYLVKTAETSYETKTIVYAAGATHARLGVPGEEKLAGRGVSYCAT
ncbi:MAG: FAD-dependent oxidoreductase, partial [Lachnospiraceae bacterium]|nr:FAD-dependent oxidoreductase [Lachnospiraceae bacterium]